MALPAAFLDELRQRLSIADVVAKRVRLTRAGREMKGLCPFHNEKTPSFTVSDDKGFFHCFGCGAHGDVIGFVMQHDRLGFMEAVELLAGEAGMAVPQATEEERAQSARQKGLHELVEAACVWFEKELAGPRGREARDYLVRRGLTEETIARFRLGYAPADAGALVAALSAQGFPVADQIEAGLARAPEDDRAPFAFFRNRVIFPVGDRRGRIVAFGGRILEGDGPKYINSPDGPLFAKGRLLYGLSRAATAAGKSHTLVVVEGYMDVIALVQAGFEAAVAPLGTALTEDQLALLWRVAPVPVLGFDGDEAGSRAAARAADRALPHLKPDHSLGFAFMPQGEDPDSLVRSQGARAMADLLAAARPLDAVLWEREVGRHRLDTPEGRAGLKSALAAVAARIGDPGVRGFYDRSFRDRVDSLFRAPPRAQAGPARKFAPAPVGPRPRRPGRMPADEAAAILVATVIGHPELFDEIEEQLAQLTLAAGPLESLRQAAIGRISGGGDLDSATLQTYLRQSGHGQSLDRLLSAQRLSRAPSARSGAPLDQARASWAEVWRQLMAGRVQGEVNQAERVLAEDMSADNLARLRALQRQVDDPDGAG